MTQPLSVAPQLEDLVPEEAHFELAALAAESFVMRPFDLADKAWANREFGVGWRDTLFGAEMNPERVGRLVFRLLKPESQWLLKARDVTVMNEVGETAEAKVGGAVLLMTLIRGPAEEARVVTALMTALGLRKAFELAQSRIRAGEEPAQTRPRKPKPAEVPIGS